MRAPSARATARGGVFTPRATCRRRASITRSVAVPSVVAMAPSSTRTRDFANGLLVGLFRRAGQLELARLDLLRRLDGGISGPGGLRLSPAGEVDAERDLATLGLAVLAQSGLLAQLVDEV